MVLVYDDAISERRQDQSHWNNEGVPYYLFNIDFAVKYMGCAWSVSTPLTDNRGVRTGSLGTHLLKHYFGSNRRLNNENNTALNFIGTIQFQMLSSMIRKWI